MIPVYQCELCERYGRADNPIDKYYYHRQAAAITCCAECGEEFNYEFWYELESEET